MEKTKEEKPRKKVVVEEVSAKPEIDEKAAAIEIPEEEKLPKAEVEEAVHHENESSRIPEKFAVKPPEEKSSALKYFLIIIPIMLILAALGGGIYVFTQNVSKTPQEVTPEPTIEEATTPSPTPTASPSKADLLKFSIAVQNGSGIAGEATKAQKLLTDAGFKVSSVGNAKAYDYTDTIIEAKNDVDETYLSQLTATLGKNYELGKPTTLADTEKTDVIIVVGKTKVQ